MARFRNVLDNLKDDSMSDSSHRVTLSSSSTRSLPASLPLFQNLLSSTTDVSDHTSTSISAHDHTPSTTSALYELAATRTKKTIRGLLDQQRDSSTFHPESLEPLFGPDRYGRRGTLGDSQTGSKHSTRAHLEATYLHDLLEQLERKLDAVSNTLPQNSIQLALQSLEQGSELARQRASFIRHRSAKEEIKRAIRRLDALDTSILEWRTRYPDTSPLRIDNSKAFLDPSDGSNTPVLIAYTLAMVVRMFEGTAERGSSVILKMLKLFGFSFAALGQSDLTVEQEATLAAIPESISTLEDKFNLDINFVPYAVCPKCHFNYHPTYPNGTKEPVYPDVCQERRASQEQPCGEPLLAYGKPIRLFEYYPFWDWFGRFIALPGIEQLGDKFCEDIDGYDEVPETKQDAQHGRFVQELRAEDGKLFVADRGTEGRWFFVLHADFFNVNGNRIRGRTSSTGVMAVTCLNLPLSMRNDSAYVYIPGLIHGHIEPDATESEHRHYVRPFVDDLIIGYTRGVCPHSTHRTQQAPTFYHRVHRVALASIVMDFKAARPFAGLADVGSHIFCFVCNCWHTVSLARTDYEAWKPVDDALLRKGAEMWRNSPTVGSRKIPFEMFGTRYSEFLRLPYYRASLQIIVDPMHAFYLVLHQRFFREHLGLNNPAPGEHPAQSDSEPEEVPNQAAGRQKKSKGKGKKKKTKGNSSKKAEESEQPETTTNFVAFYHDFIPPPLPSSLLKPSSRQLRRWSSNLGYQVELADVHRLSILEWPTLTPDDANARQLRLNALKIEVDEDTTAFQHVYEIIQDLSRRAPTTEKEVNTLSKRLSSRKWIALLWICDNLRVYPHENSPVNIRRQTKIRRNDVKKKTMAGLLRDWRLNSVQEKDGFRWPYFSLPQVRPVAPWAPPAPPPIVEHGPVRPRIFRPGERDELLRELMQSMNHRSAINVGTLHRYLTQPVKDDASGWQKLDSNLDRASEIALTFVCIDLEVLPSEIFEKKHLRAQLIAWRKTKPLRKLEPVAIDSAALLARIQQVIKETKTPAWLKRPPSDVGLFRTGTLKAAHWRTLFAIYVPFAMLSLWTEGSPLASSDCDKMAGALETSMRLTCASLIMTKRALTSKDRDNFREQFRLHLIGIKQNFPGQVFPTHHLAFHIYEFMDLFSGVRHWWAFPFERLIGKLQRLRTNDKLGQRESTLLKKACKSFGFRQWLLRPDCPPFLRYCLDLLDKAYHYNSQVRADSSPSAEADEARDAPYLNASNIAKQDTGPIGEMARLIEHNDSMIGIALAPHPSLVRLLRTNSDNVECLSRVNIPGLKGSFCIPSDIAIGNSYICYRRGQESCTWHAGQIQYIFKLGGGPVQLAVKRSRRWKGKISFSSFWDDGFEAKLVSPKFSKTLHIIDLAQVVGHTARWDISDNLVVVLNLNLK